MNFSALFRASRYLVSAASLILVTCWASVAIAQSTFSGALPTKGLDYPDPSLPEEKRDLTLRDAAFLTLQRNPELAAFGKEMRALEGATLQAGLRPNPELSVNVENIGNVQPLTGDINSTKAVAQEVVQQITTIRIYQLVELGGKRAARVNLRSLSVDSYKRVRNRPTTALTIVPAAAAISDDAPLVASGGCACGPESSAIPSWKVLSGTGTIIVRPQSSRCLNSCRVGGACIA